MTLFFKQDRFDRWLYHKDKFSLEVTSRVLVGEKSLGQGAEGGQEMSPDGG